MQNCVLDAADVLVHWHPVIGFSGCESFFGVLRVGISQEIPAGVNEGVHRVGFTSGRATAFGAASFGETLHASKRRTALPADFNAFFGQHDGKLFFRDRLYSAFVAVNQRDRTAPISLSADQPIAQSELHAPFSASIAPATQPFSLLAAGFPFC